MSATPLADRLRNAKEKWETYIPNLPENVPGQGNLQIPKGTITSWFSIVIAGVERTEQIDVDPGLKSIYWQGIENAVNSIDNHLNTAAQSGPTWLQQTTNTLQSFLWSIRSTLPWLLPLPPDIDFGNRLPRITELEGQAREIIAVSARASEAESKLAALLSNAESMQAELSVLAEKVVGYERAAQTSNTTAAASATASEAEKQRVDAHVQELDEAVTKQHELFEYFEKKRAEVDATLQGASRVALAKSFEDRRKELTKIQYFWAGFFFIGICTLTGVGIYLGIGVLQEAKAATAAVAAAPAAASTTSVAAAAASVKASQSNLLFSLLRFLILAPVVWFTWFAARQYGHSQRLGEDYAFKSAAAHAYVGYKEEMDGDEQMIKMLREYAVKNFGENPIRVLSKNEPASPLHDIFDKILNKSSPDKLIDLIKEALDKAKN
ncbi:hypothetical protein [Burkholderia sp. YIM B11467]